MVKKIIHYVWVGNKKTPMAIAAIFSWKKNLSKSWVIMEWNESNIPFDISFVKYWYDKKNYSFVSDYVRLYALNKFGGIYMDTDMFLQKPIPSEWLKKEISIARTTVNRYGMAFIIAENNNLIIRKLMEIYELEMFTKKNNHRLLFNAVLITEVLNTLYGTSCKDGCYIGQLYILKYDEAGGIDFKNKNNVVKHMFGGSWKSNSFNSEQKPIPGKYYYSELDLYKKKWKAIFRFFLITKFLRHKYKVIVRKNKDLANKIKELKTLL